MPKTDMPSQVSIWYKKDDYFIATRGIMIIKSLKIGYRRDSFEGYYWYNNANSLTTYNKSVKLFIVVRARFRNLKSCKMNVIIK